VPVFAQIGENPGFLTLLLEALERSFEVLIVVDDDFRQKAMTSALRLRVSDKRLEHFKLAPTTKACQAHQLTSRFSLLDSPRRPCHVSSTHDVQMQMENRLPTVPIGVHNHPVTRISYSLLPSHSSRKQKQVPQERAVISVIQAGNMSARNDKAVYRGLWRNVTERQRGWRFGNDVRPDIALHYSAEQTAVTHC
jgi:hypothetical protein